MSLNREDSSVEGQKASVLIRLGARVLRSFLQFPAALLAAFQEENARVTKRAAEIEDKDLIEHLPDPPHLDYGEVKYGTGVHDYF